MNASPSFWSTVRWPVGQLTMLLVLCVAVGLAVMFRREPVYEREAYTAVVIIVLSSLVLLLWALTRLVLA